MGHFLSDGLLPLQWPLEAFSVRVFRGEAQLAEAMQGLISTQGVESTSIIVQDYVKNNFEMRCFVVDGRVAHIIYSSFERVDVDGYPRDFVKYERAQAIHAWMEGDVEVNPGRYQIPFSVMLPRRNETSNLLD